MKRGLWIRTLNWKIGHCSRQVSPFFMTKWSHYQRTKTAFSWSDWTILISQMDLPMIRSAFFENKLQNMDLEPGFTILLSHRPELFPALLGQRHRFDLERACAWRAVQNSFTGGSRRAESGAFSRSMMQENTMNRGRRWLSAAGSGNSVIPEDQQSPGSGYDWAGFGRVMSEEWYRRLVPEEFVYYATIANCVKQRRKSANNVWNRLEEVRNMCKSALQSCGICVKWWQNKFELCVKTRGSARIRADGSWCLWKEKQCNIF